MIDSGNKAVYSLVGLNYDLIRMCSKRGSDERASGYQSALLTTRQCKINFHFIPFRFFLFFPSYEWMPQNWYQNDKSCYLFSDEEGTWPDAMVRIMMCFKGINTLNGLLPVIFAYYTIH